MKNIKVKLLSLGILSTIIVSSTPVFAVTRTSTVSTINNKNIVYKVPNIIVKPLTFNGEVINSNGTNLMSGPTSSSTVIAHLPEGSTFRVQADAGNYPNYVYIHCTNSDGTETGLTGYILEDDIIM